MKACPACRRLYSPSAGYCQADGAELIGAGRVEIPRDLADERVGSVILGRYRVFRVVADGGMARVYEALDESRQQNVALKVLHRELAEDPVSVERFRREYQVGSQMLHPHIVGLLDFRIAADGSHVLVMEFLGGEELRSLLKREKRIGVGRAIRLLSQAALGLDFAHAHGWVHRDLKPENLFLCQRPEGDVLKILDFGSVKDNSGGAKPLTVIGTTIGSPYYMSPEQAQGLGSVDHRTDVWALAVVLYESLFGRVPFAGNNGPSILMQILTAQPALPSEVLGVDGSVAGALDGAFAQAFVKDAAQRCPTVGHFADLLGHAYGLSGSHTVWADTSQAELEELTRRLPRVQPPMVSAPARIETASTPGAAGAPPRADAWDDEELVLAPRARRWGMWLACAALGFVLVLAFALTR